MIRRSPLPEIFCFFFRYLGVFPVLFLLMGTLIFTMCESFCYVFSMWEARGPFCPYGDSWGAARIWEGGGGVNIYFFIFGNLHVAKRQAMRFARGLRGHAPPIIFLKWCNLVRFGVYLDQILTLKYFEKYHFLYILKKNYHFLYKNNYPFYININISDTRLLWGNSCEEIF